MRFTTRKLVGMALFIAMAIIFRRILVIHLPIGIFSLAGFPIIMAGFLYGPASGAVVGAVSDVLGFPLWPTGPYSPLFTVTAALTGFIPALFVNRMRAGRAISFWIILVAIFTGQFITKVILVPYFLNVLFGIPILYKAIPNLIVEIIHTPVFALLAQSVLIACGEMRGSSPLEDVKVKTS
jgi:ECF transporter S component (folate family)